MLSNVEAVLFDLDGTLIDASEVICACFNAALTSYGLQPLPADTIKLGIGRPLKDLFTEQGNHVPTDLLAEEYKRVFAELAPGHSRPMPGAGELLASLSRRKKLGIVTSRSSAGTSKVLEDLGFLDYFSTIVGIEDVTNSKPDPAPVLLALDNLAARAHDAVLVGDTTYDMEAGARAGTRTIGVTTGFHSEERLLAAGADYVVRDLSRIQNLFGF